MQKLLRRAWNRLCLVSDYLLDSGPDCIQLFLLSLPILPILSMLLHSAYTVGIANFCGMVSSLLGSGVIQWSGMKTVGSNCDFEALPYLIVVFQILLPMVVGIPAVFLIPNVLQTEHLVDWEKEGWYEDRTDGIERSARADDDDDSVEDSRLEPHLL